MDVKDLLNEPAIFGWSADLREFVRSAAMAMGCGACWLRACGDFKGKVSKENDFRLVGGEDEEGLSNVRVRDKRTAGLGVLDVGTVTKVETGGVCGSVIFSSVCVARIGTMTSLTLDPLDLVKPAKLRAPPPSQPLLLDGRALRLTGELLPAVGQSETLPFLLKVREDDFDRRDEGVSNVRVRDSDKSTAGLDVLDVGAVAKVERVELETFSSSPSVCVARIGKTTSLTSDSLDLVKPAKLRAPPPSQPLLLDGRALRLIGELLPAIGQSETLPFPLKVKDDDFGFVGRGDEGISNVRVRDIDKSTAGLNVLDVGTVTKVETGGVYGSGTFSSLPSVCVARIGTMTSLTLDPLDLIKPAKVRLRLPAPSHPLLLDGLALRLLAEEVGQSFPLKAKLRPPEGSLAPMWSWITRRVISPGIHHTALNGPGVCTSGLSCKQNRTGTLTILVGAKE